MTVSELPEELRHIIYHAIGYGKKRPEIAWRNRFVTTPGSNDDLSCEKLVELGMMRKYHSGNEGDIFPMNSYSVTGDTILEVSRITKKRISVQ